MSFEAKHIALPRYLRDEGIVRYGFHGISCQYILDQLLQLKISLIHKKIIIAHLGSGCSVTAIKNNTSIDTSMGFSPSGGIIMNSRPGDLDPGIFTYLLRHKNLTPVAWNKLINEESGIKAIAGTNESVAELLKKEKTDTRSKEAISMFCYQVKKEIGAMAAILHGLDILVFTGGIGENEPLIRERICDGLEFLGISLDKDLNEKSAEEISINDHAVSVQIIPANEELAIAKNVLNLLSITKKAFL